MKPERETNHKKLNLRNELRVAGQGGGMGGWGDWVMDTGEGMCCGECRVLCKTDESQTCTPETNNMLYVNNKK